MNTIKILTAMFIATLVAGCGTTSWDSGYEDQAEGHPASLVEVTFGGGEAEVTKNIPGDAARGVERAVKSMRGKAPAEQAGE
jgi:hypothetical protein